MNTYQPLPRTIRKHGFLYFLLKRKRSIALFTVKQYDVVLCYEVIIIQKDKMRQIGDTVIPPHERYLRSEEFGIYGWSFQNLSQAESKFNELAEGESQ